MKTLNTVKHLSALRMPSSYLASILLLLLSFQIMAQEHHEGIDWELQKKQIKQDLDRLKIDVNKTFNQVNNQIDTIEPRTQEVVEDLATEFEKIGSDIDAALIKTERTTEKTWNYVRTDISEAYVQLQARVEKLEEQLRDE